MRVCQKWASLENWQGEWEGGEKGNKKKVSEEVVFKVRFNRWGGVSPSGHGGRTLQSVRRHREAAATWRNFRGATWRNFRGACRKLLWRKPRKAAPEGREGARVQPGAGSKGQMRHGKDREGQGRPQVCGLNRRRAQWRSREINRARGVRNGCMKQGDVQFDLASTSNNTYETSEALLPHFPSLSPSHLDWATWDGERNKQDPVSCFTEITGCQKWGWEHEQVKWQAQGESWVWRGPGDKEGRTTFSKPRIEGLHWRKKTQLYIYWGYEC